MVWLVAGLLIFLGTHSVRVLDEALRTRLIAQWGEMPWKAAYSVLSLLGFGLLIYGYGLARQSPVPLYELPLGVRHASTLLTWFAMVLLLAAYIPGNWFKVKWRHPMVLGVKLWAFAHLLSNGTLADVLLFGSFLLWAVASFSAARKRDRATPGNPLASENAPGAPLPGAPLPGAPLADAGLASAGALPTASGRSRPSTTILTVVGGTLVWAGFLLDWHASLIGVNPLGR